MYQVRPTSRRTGTTARPSAIRREARPRVVTVSTSRPASRSRSSSRSAEVESRPDFSADNYVESVVGGSVWKKIAERESAYWESVLSNSADRVDESNPVGGLIDITDHVSELTSRFMKAIQVGAHIRSAYKSRIGGFQFEYRNMELDQLTSKVLLDPEVMVIAGSFPLSFITRLTASDVDIFFAAPHAETEQLAQLVREQVTSKHSEEYFISTEHSITSQFTNTINITRVSQPKPIDEVRGSMTRDEFLQYNRLYNRYRIEGDMVTQSRNEYSLPSRYQMVLRKYKSVTEILNGFDIGCCGVAVYKGRLFATERAIYEIVNRTIMVSTNRASTTYLKRLMKYIRRGFGIHIEGVSQFSIPPDAYYFNSDNIEDMSHLEYLYGRLRFATSWDTTGDKNRARDNLREVGMMLGLSSGSDYSGGDYIRAPKWLVYGYRGAQPSKSNKSLGYYVRVSNGVEERIEVHKRDLLKKLQFITVRPYRQGSLSHHPVEIKLEEWTGTRFVRFGPATPDSILIYDPMEDIQDKLNHILESSPEELPDLVKDLSNLIVSIRGGKATKHRVETCGDALLKKVKETSRELRDAHWEHKMTQTKLQRVNEELEEERKKTELLRKEAEDHDLMVGLMANQISKLTEKLEAQS